ncbi:hypothetical protein T01_6233 [Trichinella spiralis]|uniref:Uncharacterized protein n=1 Tax=Trichinella spiralis TaxID=6334 RepID=A0A0V1BES8_TRISP|nr:hypothetical protein T01_6233 [Trichinella spiralis]
MNKKKGPEKLFFEKQLLKNCSETPLFHSDTHNFNESKFKNQYYMPYYLKEQTLQEEEKMW